MCWKFLKVLVTFAYLCNSPSAESYKYPAMLSCHQQNSDQHTSNQPLSPEPRQRRHATHNARRCQGHGHLTVFWETVAVGSTEHCYSPCNILKPKIHWISLPLEADVIVIVFTCLHTAHDDARCQHNNSHFLVVSRLLRAVPRCIKYQNGPEISWDGPPPVSGHMENWAVSGWLAFTGNWPNNIYKTIPIYRY